MQYCVQKEDACWYSTDQKEYRGGAQRVVTLDDAYLSAQAAIIRERLKMAGVRLGTILNTRLAKNASGLGSHDLRRIPFRARKLMFEYAEP